MHVSNFLAPSLSLLSVPLLVSCLFLLLVGGAALLLSAAGPLARKLYGVLPMGARGVKWQPISAHYVLS